MAKQYLFLSQRVIDLGLKIGILATIRGVVYYGGVEVIEEKPLSIANQ